MKSLSFLLLSLSLILLQADSQKKVNPESIDFDLLETTLLAAIEKQGPKFNKINFRITKVLKKTSVDLLAQYSFGNIKYAMRKNKLPARKWKRIVNQSDFKGTYKAIAIATAPLYEYPKSAKVYHDKSNSEHPFYYMQRKKKAQITTHTYESLVNYLLKNAAFSDYKKLIKSKGLSELGFAFRLEDRGDDRMPYLSLAIVGGGYRLQRLRDAKMD